MARTKTVKAPTPTIWGVGIHRLGGAGGMIAWFSSEAAAQAALVPGTEVYPAETLYGVPFIIGRGWG